MAAILLMKIPVALIFHNINKFTEICIKVSLLQAEKRQLGKGKAHMLAPVMPHSNHMHMHYQHMHYQDMQEAGGHAQGLPYLDIDAHGKDHLI